MQQLQQSSWAPPLSRSLGVTGEKEARRWLSDLLVRLRWEAAGAAPLGTAFVAPLFLAVFLLGSASADADAALSAAFSYALAVATVTAMLLALAFVFSSGLQPPSHRDHGHFWATYYSCFCFSYCCCD